MSAAARRYRTLAREMEHQTREHEASANVTYLQREVREGMKIKHACRTRLLVPVRTCAFCWSASLKNFVAEMIVRREWMTGLHD